MRNEIERKRNEARRDQPESLPLASEESHALYLLSEAVDVGSDQDNTVAGIGTRLQRISREYLDELYAGFDEDPPSNLGMMVSLCFYERSALTAIENIFDAARRSTGGKAAHEEIAQTVRRARRQLDAALGSMSRHFAERDEYGED